MEAWLEVLGNNTVEALTALLCHTSGWMEPRRICRNVKDFIRSFTTYVRITAAVAKTRESFTCHGTQHTTHWLTIYSKLVSWRSLINMIYMLLLIICVSFNFSPNWLYEVTLLNKYNKLIYGAKFMQQTGYDSSCWYSVWAGNDTLWSAGFIRGIYSRWCTCCYHLRVF